MKRVTEKNEDTGEIEYEGKVDSWGSKQGRGVEYFNNWVIKANFINDLAQGDVELYFTDDYSFAKASMIDGKLHGDYSLYNCKGFETFRCMYVDGKKNGKGFQILNAGWSLEGTWVNDEFEGENNTFYYPDGSYIRGKTVEGEFVDCWYYSKEGKKLKKLKLDIVNRDSMPQHPLDWDPYESNFIEIKQTPNMGDGMFAKRKISKGHLCSLYAGILYPHYIVDRRRWELNSNTIEVDK